MKTFKYFLFIAAVAMLTSCASTAKFPVSRDVPAANIVAKKKQDKNNNYVIKLTAENLAAPGRLSPPKNNYSVWIVTKNGDVKNLGQLSFRNAKKVVLEAVTPFDAKEILITAENEGDLAYPEGIRISRAKF
ncbi:hypothetical protein FHG64_15780 [Antarcticibacterium flavum]|uniref:Anti-sigma factor n=1 Tax=Antarcticibacterium flavum TaxID=2058175 RepID=A0A5B7X7W1_9FLAO|nr:MULTISPECIES: hypothetical protein [Antarcticibacterium]MCM4159808.1 hypothetical protein [Antarcticibacterium sp. W02-3]QCY70733.1 hypothetical protein FHG64_15780 [Antarcticibacterium flavum]